MAYKKDMRTGYILRVAASILAMDLQGSNNSSKTSKTPASTIAPTRSHPID